MATAMANIKDRSEHHGLCAQKIQKLFGNRVGV